MFTENSSIAFIGLRALWTQLLFLSTTNNMQEVWRIGGKLCTCLRPIVTWVGWSSSHFNRKTINVFGDLLAHFDHHVAIAEDLMTELNSEFTLVLYIYLSEKSGLISRYVLFGSIYCKPGPTPQHFSLTVQLVLCPFCDAILVLVNVSFAAAEEEKETLKLQIWLVYEFFF